MDVCLLQEHFHEFEWIFQDSSGEQFKTEEKDNFPNVDPMSVDCSFLKRSHKSTISHNFLDFSNESELAL